MIKKYKAFTLAEVMVVLVVLGIIASITIPQIVKRQIEASNRAKIKKAMSVYDTIIQKMVIENNFKSDTALKEWANKPNCEKSKTYFKINENSTDNNGCKFKTADNVWWDITNIMQPIVALKYENLNKNDAIGNGRNAFGFITSFDKETGSFRSNDLGFEKNKNEYGSAKNEELLTKLFGFINNEEEIKNPEPPYKWDDEWGKFLNGDFNKECGYTKRACTSYERNCYIVDENEYGWDENGDGVMSSYEECYNINFQTYDSNGVLISDSNYNTHDSIEDYFNSEYKTQYQYNENGQIVMRQECTNANCSTTTFWTSTYNYDDKGNATWGLAGCDTGGKNCNYCHTGINKGNPKWCAEQGYPNCKNLSIGDSMFFQDLIYTCYKN